MVATRFATLVLACLLCGCATLSPEDAARDRTLKQFATKQDLAGVYIYCDEWLGTTPLSNVFVDGQPLGQISSPNYLYTDVTPGTHRVTAAAGNVDSVDFDAEEGHNYYVWQELRLGLLYPGVRVHLMEENAGRVGVAGTAYVHPTYREVDLRALKAREIAGYFLGKLLFALPAAGGAGTLVIDPFMH